MVEDRKRRERDPRAAAEAAFKKATTKPLEAPAPKPAIPNVKELVSLRIDRDVLDYFQEDGPGWQDRINDALRETVKRREPPR
jgi:uncharacterized protein (DUF4415 family)